MATMSKGQPLTSSVSGSARLFARWRDRLRVAWAEAISPENPSLKTSRGSIQCDRCNKGLLINVACLWWSKYAPLLDNITVASSANCCLMLPSVQHGDREWHQTARTAGATRLFKDW